MAFGEVHLDYAPGEMQMNTPFGTLRPFYVRIDTTLANPMVVCWMRRCASSTEDATYISGTITEVGPDVEDFNVGDTVVGEFLPGEALPERGGFPDLVTVHTDNLLPRSRAQQSRGFFQYIRDLFIRAHLSVLRRFCPSLMSSFGCRRAVEYFPQLLNTHASIFSWEGTGLSSVRGLAKEYCPFLESYEDPTRFLMGHAKIV